MRPKHLATDQSKQIDTIYYTLKKLSDSGETYDAVALLQPTFPLRLSSDIKKCVKKMISTNADTIITLTKCNNSTLHTLYRIRNNNKLVPIIPASLRS